MVELTGNSESFGVISHGFNNWVFIVPALVTIPLIGKLHLFSIISNDYVKLNIIKLTFDSINHGNHW